MTLPKCKIRTKVENMDNGPAILLLFFLGIIVLTMYAIVHEAGKKGFNRGIWFVASFTFLLGGICVILLPSANNKALDENKRAKQRAAGNHIGIFLSILVCVGILAKLFG